MMMATANGPAREHAPADLGAQYASSASVALDIGSGYGALIIYPGESYRGGEIEISRVGGDGRIHTGVHERSTGAGSRLTAIFGSLAEGDWIVWADEATASSTVKVSEGAVTELVLI